MNYTKKQKGTRKEFMQDIQQNIGKRVQKRSSKEPGKIVSMKAEEYSAKNDARKVTRNHPRKNSWEQTCWEQNKKQGQSSTELSKRYVKICKKKQQVARPESMQQGTKVLGINECKIARKYTKKYARKQQGNRDEYT